MNNPLKINAPWAEVKEKLKELNTALSDEDLAYDPACTEALLKRLSKKMNRTTEEIRGWIESVAYTGSIAS